MSIASIEEAVKDVFTEFSPETFIYQLLTAYGKPKASITRLQKGNLNLSKVPGEIIWKNNLFFRVINENCGQPTKTSPGMVHEAQANNFDLHTIADQLRKSEDVAKHGLRFVIVTDYETLLAVDTKTADTLDIPLKDLPKHFDFFLPWSGQEKHQTYNESQVDIKAAYRMAKFYDEICKENPGMDTTARHSLNVFLSRILFCFFAEDTEIFPKNGMFTSSVASHTQEDGSDLNTYLDKLFEALNKEDRSAYPAYIQAFPYVNGGLFSYTIKTPKFSRQARKILIECGDLDWSEINPDIFGSMIQAVVHPDQRSETGMHYTSVSNIMKVIEPLFLNELREVFEENQDNAKGLERLLQRLYNIKIFDPACGSGNFLIIAYKELRKLEMDVYQRLREINIHTKGVLFLPQIRLTQFFGIELDDFAHEIAILSLWLAEHQMNVKFKENFGQIIPPLPLKPSGHIVCGNATRLDWEKVCPTDEKTQVYVLGNPPYLGSTYQSDSQKSDMAFVFQGIKNFKNLDYIACWFFTGANYIQAQNAKLAFVSTNSICQGEQVALLWPYVFRRDTEIAFAHRSFKWQNNAKHNAGVTVVVIGLQNKMAGKKPLFSGGSIQLVENINPYLLPGKNVIVEKAANPISQLPRMTYGNKPVDGGHLILSKDDLEDLLRSTPNITKFIKKLVGSDEFINSKDRWCIWISDELLEEARAIASITQRIELVRKTRLASKDTGARHLAARSHQFRDFTPVTSTCIIVPKVSSERREYIPTGFLLNDTVITDLAFGIYDPAPWIFAVLNSKMHNTWVRAVGGRMRTDIRYSSSLCYNTFAFPNISEKQKDMLTTHTFNILTEREEHSEKTIAQLYDPDKMPPGLLQAHRDCDAAVEQCYRSKPFTSNEERLEYLFKLYEEMTQGLQKETIKTNA